MIASDQLPIPTDVPVVLVQVLQRRWRDQRGAQREQVLIRWSNQQAVPDSWEDKLELQARFPASTAWGQAVSQEEGDVSPTDIAGPPGSVTGKEGPRTGGSTRPRRK